MAGSKSKAAAAAADETVDSSVTEDSAADGAEVGSSVTEDSAADGAEVGSSVTKGSAADGAEVGVYVYIGPTVRGIITCGSIRRGAKADIVAALGTAAEEYPQLERLIVAARNLAKAKKDLAARRGIYIAYSAVKGKLSDSKEG